jgi:hypothetical protein
MLHHESLTNALGLNGDYASNLSQLAGILIRRDRA